MLIYADKMDSTWGRGFDALIVAQMQAWHLHRCHQNVLRRAQSRHVRGTKGWQRPTRPTLPPFDDASVVANRCALGPPTAPFTAAAGATDRPRTWALSTPTARTKDGTMKATRCATLGRQVAQQMTSTMYATNDLASTGGATGASLEAARASAAANGATQQHCVGCDSTPPSVPQASRLP